MRLRGSALRHPFAHQATRPLRRVFLARAGEVGDGDLALRELGDDAEPPAHGSAARALSWTRRTRTREESEMHTRRPREETASLGREIYERDIRRQVEAEHHGEIVAIDVDSGSWAVADGEIAAVDHLRELHPSAVNVLCERVGYRALRSFGAGSQRRIG